MLIALRHVYRIEVALHETVLIYISQIEDDGYLHTEDRFLKKPIDDERSDWRPVQIEAGDDTILGAQDFLKWRE